MTFINDLQDLTKEQAIVQQTRMLSLPIIESIDVLIKELYTVGGYVGYFLHCDLCAEHRDLCTDINNSIWELYTKITENKDKLEVVADSYGNEIAQAMYNPENEKNKFRLEAV